MQNLPPSHITTTNGIEGWTITDYLGVVTASTVAGTGIVSDVFASFSDFFGGRSGSYRKQLESLYRDATSQLIQSGNQVGANWLIGLQVDHDEISGKNMQMFMISARATAVRAQPKGETKESADEGLVAAGDIVLKSKSIDLLRKASDTHFKFAEDTWKFAIEQRITELIPCVLRAYSTASEFQVNLDGKYIDAFFSCLPQIEATNLIFRSLEKHPEWLGIALRAMKPSSFGALSSSLDLLQSADPDLRFCGLQTLSVSQQYYSATNIETIDQIEAQLAIEFEDRSQIKEAKGIFGGASKKWMCLCGKDSAMDSTRCSCGRDRKGFREGDWTPEDAIRNLQSLKETLISVFKK